MKSDLVDLEVTVHHETEKAVRVSLDGDKAAAVWLPLAAIEISRRRDRETTADITLTERLALDKGLI